MIVLARHKLAAKLRQPLAFVLWAGLFLLCPRLALEIWREAR